MSSHALTIATLALKSDFDLSAPLAEMSCVPIVVPHKLSKVHGIVCDCLQVQVKQGSS